MDRTRGAQKYNERVRYVLARDVVRYFPEQKYILLSWENVTFPYLIISSTPRRGFGLMVFHTDHGWDHNRLMIDSTRPILFLSSLARVREPNPVVYVDVYRRELKATPGLNELDTSVEVDVYFMTM